MPPIPIIELTNVAKSFDDGRTHALHGISLRIEAGGFIALVGTSGSGKTTAMKMINRLLDPDRGQVRFEGAAVESLDAPTLRRGIGYVFQGIGLFPHMTIDLVELPRSYAARFPHALSGGQRQRAGVARAIAARPRVMLMDEPFGALDPITRDALGTAYRTLHDRLAMTTVMVTHDVQEAVLLADRIVVMSAGRIVADDTPGALLAGHASAEVSALMAMPRRQAERIGMLLETSGNRFPRPAPHG